MQGTGQAVLNKPSEIHPLPLKATLASSAWSCPLAGEEGPVGWGWDRDSQRVPPVGMGMGTGMGTAISSPGLCWGSKDPARSTRPSTTKQMLLFIRGSFGASVQRNMVVPQNGKEGL